MISYLISNYFYNRVVFYETNVFLTSLNIEAIPINIKAPYKKFATSCQFELGIDIIGKPSNMLVKSLNHWNYLTMKASPPDSDNCFQSNSRIT